MVRPCPPVNRQILMKRPDGTPFPSASRTVDPESIRVAPNGNLYWSSEGNWNANPTLRYQSFVREMKTDGSYVRQFNTPAMFDYVDNTTTGLRSNKGFEALTVAPGGKLFTANEDALIQDGSLSTLASGSVVRVTALDTATGEGVTMDNVEGISWGHTLANGNRSLVLAVDNNFSAAQTNLFMAFEVSAVPEPQAWALMLAGLAAVSLRRRARR